MKRYKLSSVKIWFEKKQYIPFDERENKQAAKVAAKGKNCNYRGGRKDQETWSVIIDLPNYI